MKGSEKAVGGGFPVVQWLRLSQVESEDPTCLTAKSPNINRHNIITKSVKTFKTIYIKKEKKILI